MFQPFSLYYWDRTKLYIDLKNSNKYFAVNYKKIEFIANQNMVCCEWHRREKFGVHLSLYMYILKAVFRHAKLVAI